jgi:hypothetical protein
MPPFNRTIDVDIYEPMEDSELSFMRHYGVPLPQPTDVASGTYILLQALSRLESLRYLRLNIPTNGMTEYEEIVNHTEISPIKATRVALGPFAESVLRHMPEVKDVSIYGWKFIYQKYAQQRLMGAMMGLPLEHVELASNHDISRHVEGMIDSPLHYFLLIFHSPQGWNAFAEATFVPTLKEDG